MRSITTAASLGFVLFLCGNGFAGSNPVNPAPPTDINIPETPEGRKNYKIHALEQAIAADKTTIANAGSSKAVENQQLVKTATANLKTNEDVLARIKAGEDMDVFFCSQCGREYMKEGTCPHCKKPLTSLFAPGAKRPPLAPTSPAGKHGHTH